MYTVGLYSTCWSAYQEQFYVGAEGHVPPKIHLLPSQIQKLADRSDVISAEVLKCSKI